MLPADITAYTDHRGLEYLLRVKGNKQVKPRIARWLEFLADFQNLKIKYKTGASNVVADALSRSPYFIPEEDTYSKREESTEEESEIMIMEQINETGTTGTIKWYGIL